MPVNLFIVTFSGHKTWNSKSFAPVCSHSFRK